MALPATSVFEVETGGSDSLNGGLFDTASTGKPTDLAATLATSAAPVVTSATYNFVAGDVGNWLYVQAGTNWTPGFYKIASVATNAATLNATIGAAVLANGTPTTVTGCATTASPTAGTWAVDYSQQGGVQFSLTGLTTAAANAIILTASATKAMVGNGIVITSTGTGGFFILGYYCIIAVSAGVSLTVDRNCTSAAGAAGTAGLGGALASPGMASGVAVTGNTVWVTGSYSITSTSLNVAGGVFSFATGRASTLSGYGSVRGDLGQATYTVTLSSTNVLTSDGVAFTVNNMIFDGGSQASSKLYNQTGGAPSLFASKCTIKNFTSTIIGIWEWIRCLFDTCAGPVNGAIFDDCTIRNAASTGGIQAGTSVTNCLIYANTGYGLSVGVGNQIVVKNNTFYNNTSDAIQVANNGSICAQIENNVFSANGAYGVNQGGNIRRVLLSNNAFFSNTSGQSNSTSFQRSGDITLTADPFNNAAGGDFSLNNTAGGGAACKAAGIPGTLPGGLSTGYLDIGAVQSKASGGTKRRAF